MWKGLIAAVKGRKYVGKDKRGNQFYLFVEGNRI
jgi:hypothetical protein